MKQFKKLISLALTVSVLFLGMVQPAQAALVGSDQVAETVIAPASQQDRARVMEAFSRPEVQAELVKRGVDPAQARDRIAALSDEETATLARQIDAAPAGGNAIIGAIVFVFLVLLITDILGLTKIFPFTRSVR